MILIMGVRTIIIITNKYPNLGNNRIKHETSFNGVLSLLHSLNIIYLTIPLENKLEQFRLSGMILVATHYHIENENQYQLS